MASMTYISRISFVTVDTATILFFFNRKKKKDMNMNNGTRCADSTTMMTTPNEVYYKASDPHEFRVHACLVVPVMHMLNYILFMNHESRTLSIDLFV